MALESIELYKPWEDARCDPKDVFFVSRKLDGVPVRFRKLSGRIIPVSRQNEIITSLDNFTHFADRMLDEGGSFVGELYIEGVPFKDIGGYVNRKVPDADTRRLVLNVFDFDVYNMPSVAYADRWEVFRDRMIEYQQAYPVNGATVPVRLVPHFICQGPAAVMNAFNAIMKQYPNAEGAIAHNVKKPFQPGTRRWDTMKIKPHEDIDLWVIGYEEAVDKYGRPKNMVGGINVRVGARHGDGEVTFTESKIGPGRMTLKERKEEWHRFKDGRWSARLAQVHYMKDDTYVGLREGRWQRWRDDKDEAGVRQFPVAQAVQPETGSY